MTTTSKIEAHQSQSYFFLRVGIGLTFAIHGALRFAQESYFTDLILSLSPESSVEKMMFPFAYLMPAVELLAGFLLCFGYLKRLALAGLSLVMLVWILSSILLDYWQNMAPQLLFFFFLYWLYARINEDRWSFDSFLKY